MESNIEIWKNIIGYENYYQISNCGRLKRKSRVIMNNNKPQTLKEKIICPYKNKKGYLLYRLRNENSKIKCFSAHRLVALQFIPNPNNKSQVNHIDGNKENNHVNNLEWCTLEENIEHACKNGLRHDANGENNGFSKLTEEMVVDIVELLNKGYKGVEIAKIYNVSPSTINCIKLGKSWSHITKINKQNNNQQ